MRQQRQRALYRQGMLDHVLQKKGVHSCWVEDSDEPHCLLEIGKTLPAQLLRIDLARLQCRPGGMVAHLVAFVVVRFLDYLQVL